MKTDNPAGLSRTYINRMLSRLDKNVSELGRMKPILPADAVADDIESARAGYNSETDLFGEQLQYPDGKIVYVPVEYIPAFIRLLPGTDSVEQGVGWDYMPAPYNATLTLAGAGDDGGDLKLTIADTVLFFCGGRLYVNNIGFDGPVEFSTKDVVDALNSRVDSLNSGMSSLNTRMKILSDKSIGLTLLDKGKSYTSGTDVGKFVKQAWDSVDDKTLFIGKITFSGRTYEIDSVSTVDGMLHLKGGNAEIIDGGVKISHGEFVFSKSDDGSFVFEDYMTRTMDSTIFLTKTQAMRPHEKAGWDDIELARRVHALGDDPAALQTLRGDLAYTAGRYDWFEALADTDNRRRFGNGAFTGDTGIVYAPAIDTSRVIPSQSTMYYMKEMYKGCTSMVEAPPLDCSGLDGARGEVFNVYEGCTSLVTAPGVILPQGDTSALNLRGLFFGCASLVDATALNQVPTGGYSFMFRGCTSLVNAPVLDLREVTGNCMQIFTQCSSLKTADVSLWKLNEGVKIDTAFSECVSLETLTGLDSWDISKADGAGNLFLRCGRFKWDGSCIVNLALPQAGARFSQIFSGCALLREIHITMGAAETGADMFGMFNNCTALEKLETIDYRDINLVSRDFSGCVNLRYVKMVNLGQNLTFDTSMPAYLNYYDFTNLTAWGDGSDENRQTLVDSLLTHSYNRTAAGWPSINVVLAPAAKARLTDEEIAAITAKGFNIV